MGIILIYIYPSNNVVILVFSASASNSLFDDNVLLPSSDGYIFAFGTIGPRYQVHGEEEGTNSSPTLQPHFDLTSTTVCDTALECCVRKPSTPSNTSRPSPEKLLQVQNQRTLKKKKLGQTKILHYKSAEVWQSPNYPSKTSKSQILVVKSQVESQVGQVKSNKLKKWKWGFGIPGIKGERRLPVLRLVKKRSWCRWLPVIRRHVRRGSVSGLIQEYLKGCISAKIKPSEN